MVRSLFAAAFCVLAACATPPCEDMRESDGGLVVTEAEHGLAWGEASCDSCHLRRALHTRSCTPDVDLAAVRSEVEETGLDGCAACHGSNGVGE